jgi:hypothetical protein
MLTPNSLIDFCRSSNVKMGLEARESVEGLELDYTSFISLTIFSICISNIAEASLCNRWSEVFRPTELQSSSISSTGSLG